MAFSGQKKKQTWRILDKRPRDFEMDLEGEREFLVAVKGENNLIEPHNVFDHVQVVDNIFYTSDERDEEEFPPIFTETG